MSQGMERGQHFIAQGDREERDQIPKRGSGAGNGNLMMSQEETKAKQLDPVKSKMVTLAWHGTCKWPCPSSCFDISTHRKKKKNLSHHSIGLLFGVKSVKTSGSEERKSLRSRPADMPATCQQHATASLPLSCTSFFFF